MSFDSWHFAVFLPVVLLGYSLLGRRGQNLWLLGASYFFYGSWDWRFLSLILFSTGVDYWVSRRLGQVEDPKRRRFFLSISLVTNLGLLGVFKYLGWFCDSMVSLFSQLGWEVSPWTLNVILPVGISFYTFQTLGYTIDVYRRQIEPCRSLLDFALYVAFFPQLVAGPIERASRLLPQLQAPRRPRWKDYDAGSWLILSGLFKKMALADAMAPFVQEAFADPAHASSGVLWRGAYLFAFQIYFDFSGYSDIARGCSRFLGIELMENFRQPFFSRSTTELWRRWHVSLSTWFRDYLYIPLGGNRGGPFAGTRNVLITMTVSGLWHGASGTMLAWGFLNGSFLAVERALGIGGPRKTLWGKGLGLLITFHLFVLSFVFFRAPDFPNALEYYQGLLRLGDFDPSSLYRVAFYGGLLLLLDLPCERAGSHLGPLRWPLWWRGVVMGVMLIFLMAWSRGQDVPFIYFQF